MYSIMFEGSKTGLGLWVFAGPGEVPTYDDSFQKDLKRDEEVERIARQVLGVEDGVSGEELKRAWRRKCLEHHPDRNPGDPDAERKFLVVNCAYRLLAEGVPCDMLREKVGGERESLADGEYNLENAWGMFLWWRDRFF
jgi:hypothetical protein